MTLFESTGALALTKLVPDLEGVDPDDAFRQVWKAETTYSTDIMRLMPYHVMPTDPPRQGEVQAYFLAVQDA